MVSHCDLKNHLFADCFATAAIVINSQITLKREKKDLIQLSSVYSSNKVLISLKSSAIFHARYFKIYLKHKLKIDLTRTAVRLFASSQKYVFSFIIFIDGMEQ